jgi:hypothetical protein
MTVIIKVKKCAKLGCEKATKRNSNYCEEHKYLSLTERRMRACKKAAVKMKVGKRATIKKK